MEDRSRGELTGVPATPRSTDVGAVVRRGRVLAPEPLTHLPPLDGLRAVAVLVVLLYHARFPWIPGGFLGVSMFFTLSGFLITSLLLREWAASAGASIDLRAFWQRRFRRLLPASWATIGLVVLAGVVGVWNTDQLRSLGGDVRFALLELVNWHFIAEDRGYGGAFEAPSPLEHFWSLAVEQQFYLLLPLLVVAVLSLGSRCSQRGRLRILVAVFGALTVYSAVANAVLARSSVDRAYLGTDTRMAELLIGALLACATLERLRRGSELSRRVLGGVGLLAVAVLAYLWGIATVQSDWLYPWGLLLSAAATGAVIIAALQGGVLARVLDLGPLRWLGRISYGVYLLHWPVYLWLTPARTALSPWPLFGLRFAVTLGAATLMYHLLEQPVRSGRTLRGRWPLPVATLSAALLVAGTVSISTDLPEENPLALADPAVDITPVTTPPPPPPLRVLVLGDEIAAAVGDAANPHDRMEATSVVTAGCGLAVAGFVLAADGSLERDADRCGDSRAALDAALESTRSDVVLITGALRDAAARRIAVDRSWSGPDDLEVAGILRDEIADLVDAAVATGAEVALLTTPYVWRTQPVETLGEPEPHPDPAQQAALLGERMALLQGAPVPAIWENDQPRIDALNRVLTVVARSREVPLLDLAAVVNGFPGGPFDPWRRHAGLGFTRAGGLEVARWLAPHLGHRSPTTEALPVPFIDDTAPLPVAPDPGPRRVVPPRQRVNVLVAGDSVSFTLGTGLIEWAEERPGVAVGTMARFSCPIARGGGYRFQQGRREFDDHRCDWSVEFAERLNVSRPDVVVLSSGIWEVVDRRLPGDDRYRHIGSPDVDHFILSEFLRAIDLLGSDGAQVLVLTQPLIESGADQGYQGLPESEPERMERLNELLGEAVAARPGVAQLIDLRGWMAARPEGEMDPTVRPDGTHFSNDGSRVVAQWLGPEVERIARGG